MEISEIQTLIGFSKCRPIYKTESDWFFIKGDSWRFLRWIPCRDPPRCQTLTAPWTEWWRTLAEDPVFFLGTCSSSWHRWTGHLGLTPRCLPNSLARRTGDQWNLQCWTAWRNSHNLIRFSPWIGPSAPTDQTHALCTWVVLIVRRCRSSGQTGPTRLSGWPRRSPASRTRWWCGNHWSGLFRTPQSDRSRWCCRPLTGWSSGWGTARNEGGCQRSSGPESWSEYHCLRCSSTLKVGKQENYVRLIEQVEAPWPARGC